MIHLLRIVDHAWHFAFYRLFVRWDRLHLFMYRKVCTPVADWEKGD